MDGRQYIESGKLESFVLGNCSREEALEAECMARIFPEVKRELETLQVSLEKYALASSVDPPAAMKSTILAAIKAEKNDSVATSGKVVNITSPAVQNKTVVNLLMAACIALVIICAFVVYNLNEKNRTLSDNVINLQNEQQKVQQDLILLQQQLASSQNQLAVIYDTASTTVRMKGLPLSPQSLATVYWNNNSKQVYLAVNSLPLPPQGKQYQLWGIVNGSPVDLGVFEVSSGNNLLLQQMKPVEGAVAFAVTLEKAGGSPTPTLAEMYVMGNI